MGEDMLGVIGGSSGISGAIAMQKVLATRTSDIAVNSGAQTNVSFNAAVFNPDSLWDISTPDRFTPTSSGLYLLGFRVTWGVSVIGVRTIMILDKLNLIKAEANESPVASLGTTQSLTICAMLDAGDFVQFAVKQTAGLPLNLLSSNQFSTAAWCIKLTS